MPAFSRKVNSNLTSILLSQPNNYHTIDSSKNSSPVNIDSLIGEYNKKNLHIVFKNTKELKHARSRLPNSDLVKQNSFIITLDNFFIDTSGSYNEVLNARATNIDVKYTCLNSSWRGVFVDIDTQLFDNNSIIELVENNQSKEINVLSNYDAQSSEELKKIANATITQISDNLRFRIDA